MLSSSTLPPEPAPSLETFKRKIQGYLRLSRNSQKELADALGLHPKVLGRKLSSNSNAILSYPEIQTIVKTLAQWRSILTRSEALELLTLSKCPPFTLEEWDAPPLDRLEVEQVELPEENEGRVKNGQISSHGIPHLLSGSPSERVASNLPTALTNFIGRGKEVAEIKQILAPRAARLITLTGVGGIGKSRLAFEVASQLLNHFADGLWLIDLAAVTDPSLIPQAIAEVFDLAEQANQPILKTLAEYLKTRQLLLVLNDCEHLVDACARVANILMSACPNIQFLVTSREALRIPGEVIFRIPSLSLPKANNIPDLTGLLEYEAVRLFVDRARSANSLFALSEQNVPDLIQLCRKLDGIPLAIELAAARTNILSVEQINARLTDRFHLLKSGSNRTALPRQQTLRGLIDWSYNLLTETEKLLFQRFSIFSSSFSLQAAETVGSDPGIERHEVLDLIFQLANKSLIVVEEEPNSQLRYRYLETIRKYAQEQLEASGEAGLLKRNHLHYFVELAEEAYAQTVGARQLSWFSQLDREQDNLRAALGGAIEDQLFESALQLSGALGRYWYVRCYYSEGLNWLQASLPHYSLASDEKNKPYLARALYWMATLAMPLGQYQQATPLYEQSLALSRELNDKRNITSVLNRLGELARNQGRYEEARHLLEESLTLARQLGDHEVIANALCNYGEVEWDQGNYDLAKKSYQESLEVFTALGDQLGLAKVTLRLGQVARIRGSYRHAQELCEQSYQIFEHQNNLWGMASCLHRQGQAAFDLSHYIKASQLFENSFALFNQHGDKWGIAEQLADLGNVFVVQGKIEMADQFFMDSLTLYREIGIRLQIANLIVSQGELALHQGDYNKARTSLTEVLLIQRELAAKPGIARTLTVLAELAYQQGDYQQALALNTESLELNRVMNSQLNLANNLEGLSRIYVALNEIEKANQAASETATIRRSIAADTELLG